MAVVPRDAVVSPVGGKAEGAVLRSGNAAPVVPNVVVLKSMPGNVPRREGHTPTRAAVDAEVFSTAR